jgi:uncharacterized protein with ParB-like and HNH nuclease domain
MKKIIGREKPLADLLSRKKYTIHYYQREYRWGKKQIEELLEDLTEEFLENYNETSEGDHTRAQVAGYGHYYLGSIVVTDVESDRAIIDGQQRLTSLTLLLMYLENLQKSRAEKVSISDLIYSEEYGAKSFNISVEERHDCLMSIFEGNLDYDATLQSESVKNILARYRDIDDLFPEDLTENALPYFIDWLIKKVYLVEITAYTEQDANKIFVSMNDRGLSLTPTEMLKGFLLSEIKNDLSRNKANDLWKEKILAIKNIAPESTEEDADFIKNWLRGQYAETIREKKKDAEKEDFDLIGTEFHKWVRENAKTLDLRKPEDYERFILKELKLFADTYIRLKQYSSTFDAEYEYVFYNANRNFTLQYQMILGAIDPNDTQEIINKKIKAVSCFIDQYISIRVFNFKKVDYSGIKNAMFITTKALRRCPLNELPDRLKKQLDATELSLDGINRFRLNQFTHRYMLHTLSRITYYIENACGLNTKFEDLVNRNIKNPFDIEHIWADHYELHKDECPDEEDFESTRNRFGALLILPRDKNRSFQDKPYHEKVIMYFGENLLAKSLYKKGYENNPHFIRFKDANNFKFESYDNFTKKEITARQALYKDICSKIWDTNKFAELTK